ncbi:MAG TPA: PQQ-dependent sugar dehydrogenase [Candidatus Binatia bacterium]|nr:PQQ-dependent sugar dehydrogenase [Candidatus Binatia bacterium]
MRLSSACFVILLLAPFAARAGTPVAGFDDTSVIASLNQPTAIAFLPDGRMLVTQKGGALLRVDSGVATTLTTIPVCSGSEMGLLGVAVDPAFATNGFVYLYRTLNTGSCTSSTGRFNQVVRVTVSGNTAGSLTVLLTGIQTDNGNHDGGVLRIGPDGKLYIGAGDSGVGDNVGGPGSSTNPYAQSLSSLNGKVLRINLDGSIPADNPFVSTAGAQGAIWAYGFRNPFRFSFDDMTGTLWIADVGDLTVEEIDLGVAGGNYSWPRCEGDLQGPPSSPQPCVYGTDVAPIFTYPHSGGSSLGTCVIGGAFGGAAFGAMAGDYVFGDCTSSDVYLAMPNGTRDDIAGTPTLISSSAGTPSDFVPGPDGAIYYTAEGAGEVRRLAVTGAVTTTTTTTTTLPGGGALLSGRSLKLTDNVDPTRRSLKTISTDATIDVASAGSTDDPTLHDGSLRVRSSTGSFDSTYPLPAAGWSYIGDPAAAKGYRFKSTSGPITKALLKGGRRLKVSGKGSGLLYSLATNPNPVDVVLTTGTKQFCMSFGGTVTFTAGRRYSAKNSSMPGPCPP